MLVTVTIGIASAILIAIASTENNCNCNGNCGNSSNNATNYKWHLRYRSFWNRNFCNRLACTHVFQHSVVLFLYFFGHFFGYSFNVLLFRNFVLFFHCFLLSKSKSAATEVTAPKNATPIVAKQNLCHTSL